jgi:hypothetical protein
MQVLFATYAGLDSLTQTHEPVPFSSGSADLKARKRLTRLAGQERMPSPAPAIRLADCIEVPNGIQQRNCPNAYDLAGCSHQA